MPTDHARSHPPGLIVVHGVHVVRRAGWLEPGERPQCPFGHDVHDHAVMLGGEMVVWCKYKPAPKHPECGALVFIAQVPHIGRYCADVTTEEMKMMEREHMTAAQVFNFLGVRFAPGQLAERRVS